ncbi:right-handed parallel beta-helix repeat-containing protein [Sphingomonas sp. HT-1]|uniref:right-handed parallel beta-helix repeat-containing protein n=2 Tax=Sphingomonas TaxID=13687 RepID=UPI000A5B05CB|nr:right-handed parallel beta-helix repeat-containing protein [Sphingomonas sp. WG]
MIATLAMLSAITVNTKAQLDAAIANARGGEVIRLQRANYDTVVIRDRTFSSPIVIQSAYPNAPAMFKNLRVRNVRNVTFNNIEFTRIRGTDPDWAKMVDVNGGANITFNGGFVHGPANGMWQDDMYGIHVRNVTNLRVSGITFHDLRVALVVEDSTNFTIENNVFSHLSRDAMEIPGTRNGRIHNNSMSMFTLKPGDHPDGIQCWTAGKTTGCKNIQITMNRLIASPGNEFQGIFFGDEAKVGGYDNLQIIGNTFVNVMWHGINIEGPGTGVVIRNNSLSAGPNYRPWIRTVGPATLSGNIAPMYIIAGKQETPPGNKVGGQYKAQ